MPGTGTKPATTKNNPPARLLDLTRLTRRAGRHLTGVDRVEFAYARALTTQPEPCFGLVRTALGYLLIAPDMVWPVVQRICHGKRHAPDMLSRLTRGRTRAEREAETEMRLASWARCRPSKLSGMLKARLPAGFAYINVGHSNLTQATFSAVRQSGGRSVVMVHDVIPLDHPEFQRDGTVSGFEQKMKAVSQLADTVLYNSEDTLTKAESWFHKWGRVPDSVVAHLGVEPPEFHSENARPDLSLSEPYFMCIGTIEPRKNIGFLLDLWDRMGADAPLLLICGARGWKSEDVFARLDTLPTSGRVREHNRLNDPDLHSLLLGSNGLLFPSHAEGFGLPAAEAAQLGVPVLCNTLPVFRETLGDIPIYASVQDPYLWIKQLEILAGSHANRTGRAGMQSLTWDAHFKTVLSIT